MKGVFALVTACLAFAPSTRANVFNHDDRVQIDGSQSPWSAVGRLEVPHFGWCTATLVARDLIVTAAHCAMPHDEGTPVAGDYVFQAGYNDEVSVAKSKVVFFWYGSGTPGKVRTGDWAIGKLAEPIGDQAGWWDLENLDINSRFRDAFLSLAGYSVDFKIGDFASLASICSVQYLDPDGIWKHTCSMSSGASGGPLFYFGADEQGRPRARIVGINFAEQRTNGTENGSLLGVDFSRDVANLAVPVRNLWATWLAISQTGK